MKTNNKIVSLEQCQAIMNKDGLEYTDEELLKIRDFMYRIMEITASHFERLKNNEAKVIHINSNQSPNEKKSISIRSCKHRRAS